MRKQIILGMLLGELALLPLLAADAPKMGAEWEKLDVSRIGSAVKLFRDDWMALAAGKPGDFNAMTIGWGGIGVLWRRPVVTVYVSSSRHTWKYMEKYPQFTVTYFKREYRPALQYIGTHSGRDGDKLKAAGLHAVFTPQGNPIFQEATIAIECRTLFKTVLALDQVPPEIKAIYGNGMGPHTMYIGEVLNCWIRK